MGKIFLVHDFSPSQPWLHAVLNSNRELFASQGPELAPFNPWTCELVPSHGFLWLPRAADNPVSPVVSTILAQVADILEHGQDALLFSHTPLLAGHQSFQRILSKETGINLRDINAIFIVSSPLLSLEQRYRETNALSDKTGEIYVDAYANLPFLLRQASEVYGNVSIIANTQDDPRTVPAPDIAQKVFAYLGCQGKIFTEIQACHPLYYKSCTARRLSWLTRVRGNSWPRMDEGGYAQTLLRMDEKWERDIASPLAMRKKLRSACASSMCSLEKEFYLTPFSLECPPWLLEGRETDLNFLPDTGKISDFAANLPEHEADALLRRYSNDERLLSPDQKILYSALLEKASPEIRHIGETEPPVELSVLTMTYNHEKYITDCMESVLAQRTDFPVRHIVLDHCSSDDTAAIISSYAEKHPSIQPVLLSRRQPEENVRGLFERCASRYAALCDGDDFFTDPLKLQKQVDYLEKRPHCALCFHPVAVVFENGTPPFRFPSLDNLPRRRNDEYYLADLTKGNFIQTNSVVYRWIFRDGLPSWFRADLCPGDWYWHLLHAEKGRIGFLHDTMALYRRHENALYAHAFLDTKEHRRSHGIAELAAYKAYNDHFGGRYFRNFSDLAAGVFADFFEIASQDGDFSLLDEAGKKFPEFALEFFRQVNSVQKRMAHDKHKAGGRS